MVEHLYAHIPFCPKVCPYCSFYKEASDRNKTRAFLDAVLREAEIWGDRLQPRTIFFGGGTPTALSTSQLDYLISGLRERMDFSRLEEFTIEMNPATVSLEKASRLRELGVNRVSMGVQSWDPGLLETLGRVHSKDQALRSHAILRDAGFDNINLDFIFGIPGQSVDQWVDTLRQTIALQPQHVSAYCLTYEEDTEYFLRLGRGEFSQDPEVDAALLSSPWRRSRARAKANTRFPTTPARAANADTISPTGWVRTTSASAPAPFLPLAGNAGRTSATRRITWPG